jgi:hypothetical protein
MAFLDARIRYRVNHILTNNPKHLNLTFDENKSVAFADLLVIPLFHSKKIILEQMTNALRNDSENRFVLENDRIRLNDASN